ncbi:phage tail length tape measure family protein [uncultured Butyricimonas sp.]|uniref:phage tail length tape measure family protein n=1 Tax=uncultured Butyricimonas sp. TaxID=1268785 RepID=UPI0026DC61B7|nr:phage tail length tape measure family protein [uncultured Butyricimonas sp.]
MSVISRLKVWLTADTKEFSDRLNKGKKEVSGFSSAMKKVGGVIAGAFALSSIKSFLTECQNLWKVQEKAENKLESVIKATGGAAELTADQMKKYASSLQDVTTYGDEVTIDAMSIMATFKSIKGDVFKEAIKSAQDMAYVMNTDLNQAALQLGKALESPELGLNALRRSGVSFSTEQIAQIKKLVAEGKKQEAQLIMLKELQTEFGGAAANAANTATGATVQLSNAWGDLKETVGKAVTPSIEAIKYLTKVIQANNAVIADESIPTWKKWLGYLVPGLNRQNRMQAEEGIYLKEINDKEIKNLKLYSLSLEELNEAFLKWNKINIDSNFDYNETLAAIVEETRLRKSGVAAMTEQQKKEKEIQAMSEKSIQDIDDKINAYNELYTIIDKNDKVFADSIKKEIASLQQAKEQIKALTVDEIAKMSENTSKAISDKIKSYQGLLSAVEMTDLASAIAYTREINRLETLIAKNKELVNAKLRQEVDVPVIKAQPSLGVEGALIDNTPYLAAFQKIIDLPKILKPATGELRNLQGEMLDISNEISGAFANMAVGVGESIGELIAGGGGMAGFTKLVGGAFADMAIQVGRIAIGVGMATEAIKASLVKLGGLGAIAAGVALVALGTAAKSALSSVANGGGGTFSSNAYSNELDVRTKSGTLDKVSRSVNVEVSGEFKLQGNTLVAAINKENRRKNLTT